MMFELGFGRLSLPGAIASPILQVRLDHREVTCGGWKSWEAIELRLTLSQRERVWDVATWTVCMNMRLPLGLAFE